MRTIDEMKRNTKEILRVLVGSRAYGLADERSDIDQHVVYVIPTHELLSINSEHKITSWQEGIELDGRPGDLTGWEVGQFFKLACQCNPTVLDAFFGPIVNIDGVGHIIRILAKQFLSKKRIYKSYIGYASNQRKKMFDPGNDGLPEKRAWKYSVAYLRVLYHGQKLLREGTLDTLVLPDLFASFLRDVKAGRISLGAIIDKAIEMEFDLEKAYHESELPEEMTLDNLTTVNNVLLEIRKEIW